MPNCYASQAQLRECCTHAQSSPDGDLEWQKIDADSYVQPSSLPISAAKLCDLLLITTAIEKVAARDTNPITLPGLAAHPAMLHRHSTISSEMPVRRRVRQTSGFAAFVSLHHSIRTSHRELFPSVRMQLDEIGLIY